MDNFAETQEGPFLLKMCPQCAIINTMGKQTCPNATETIWPLITCRIFIFFRID